MKKKDYFICLLTACLMGTSCGSGQNKVKMDKSELEAAVKEKDDLASTQMEGRKDLFRILLLMNEVTGYTFKLESERELKGSINGNNMAEQLFQRMKLLKEELEEARQNARQNAELLAEIDELQRSFESKEREITRLHIDIEMLDTALVKAVAALDKANKEIEEENRMQTEENNKLKATMAQRQQEERNAWLVAGDELIEAARTIPRAHTGIFVGNQSIEITHSKQILLNRATESYNQAVRMSNQVNNRQAAAQARQKALESHRLFELVSNYESIGEEAYNGK